jgi:hypothetical protein
MQERILRALKRAKKSCKEEIGGFYAPAFKKYPHFSTALALIRAARRFIE